MNATRCTLVLCLAAALWAGCASSPSATARSRDHMRLGNYGLAHAALVEEMGEEAVQDSEDPWVRLVYLMNRMQIGQELVFNNQEYQAIDVFEEVLDREPGNTTATKWIQKAKIKLASKAVIRGDEHQRSGELSEALMAYHDAVGYVPDYPPALKGVEQVIKQIRARETRADDQYVRGVDALGQSLYGVTWYHMVNAIDLNPDHAQAREKRDAVAQRMTRDRYERALALEDSGYYGAALKEYQAIQQRDPDWKGLTSRIERMRREVETERLIRDAEMAAFRNQFIKAREILEKAFQTTSLQQAKISDLLLVVKEREADDKYQRAKILELENHLEEALAAYKDIDASWQLDETGFKDVKDRITDLSSTVQIASEAYTNGLAAEEAGDLDEAIDAYNEALLVYPGYRGLEKKVADLEAQLQREAAKKAKAAARAEAAKKLETEPKTEGTMQGGAATPKSEAAPNGAAAPEGAAPKAEGTPKSEGAAKSQTPPKGQGAEKTGSGS